MVYVEVSSAILDKLNTKQMAVLKTVDWCLKCEVKLVCKAPHKTLVGIQTSFNVVIKCDVLMFTAIDDIISLNCIKF